MDESLTGMIELAGTLSEAAGNRVLPQEHTRAPGRGKHPAQNAQNCDVWCGDCTESRTLNPVFYQERTVPYCNSTVGVQNYRISEGPRGGGRE